MLQLSFSFGTIAVLFRYNSLRIEVLDEFSCDMAGVFISPKVVFG